MSWCLAEVPNSLGSPYNLTTGSSQQIECTAGYRLEGEGLLHCTEAGLQPAQHGTCIRVEQIETESSITTYQPTSYPAKMIRSCRHFPTSTTVYRGPVVGSPITSRDTGTYCSLQ